MTFRNNIGKLRLLQDIDKHHTVIKPKVVTREIISHAGGTITVKVHRKDDGDLLITRRLAKIIFNKDWGKFK